MRKVVVIGGTGVFGKRLIKHLVKRNDVALTVTSRSLLSANRFAAQLVADHPGVSVDGAALDTNKNLQARLEELKPWCVIDCSGPFQNAGYNTARTALKCGSHIIDLADARDYLLGYKTALDPVASTRGLCAIAGASSTPALSSAVIAELAGELEEIVNIDIAIVPGGRSEVGEAVVAAVLSYAGLKIPVWKSGKLDRATGWRGAHSIDVPQLGSRRVAAVETVDAEWLSQLHAVTGRIGFFAGLESQVEQRGIELLALLRQTGVLQNLHFLAPLLVKARKLTRWLTSDRGGMVVVVEGIGVDEQPVKKRWSLLATHDHGPCVPVMAAAAILNRLLLDKISPGAAIAQLPLADINQEMAGYAISTRIEHL